MDGETRELLEYLDVAAGDGSAELAPVLAQLAGGGIAHDPDELNAAVRRALLLLATGGDPGRAIGPDDRAVTALADDLAGPGHGEALAAGLAALAGEAAGLPRVESALAALRADGELAWRAYAAALLADELVSD